MATFITAWSSTITNWATAKSADTERFARYFRAMLDNGVYVAPSQFEAGFISLAHGPAEIGKTVADASEVLRTL